ncbi:MAG TPA: ribonuclease HII [Clostridiales bacterium]|nr:ribonuclease HII [Clostridiales bacterium]
MLEIENSIYERGFKLIACIDEVGRGCLAVNVTACAVIMPKGLQIEGVNDSKVLSRKNREARFSEICKQALYIGIGTASNKEIDLMNIKRATHMAMIRAVENLSDKDGMRIKPDFLLIDAEKLPMDIQQMGIIKGDSKCHGIAAASIVAKVTRDKEMSKLHDTYPMYNFKNNAGYGTKEHIKALQKFGKCELHRNTFLKKILDNNEQIAIYGSLNE